MDKRWDQNAEGDATFDNEFYDKKAEYERRATNAYVFFWIYNGLFNSGQQWFQYA